MSHVRHFTATGFVVHEGHVALHWHGKVQAWLPPGGHIDENEDPVQAVLREIREESGLEAEVVSAGPPFRLDYPKQVEPPVTIMVEDIHDPDQGYHQHIDMIYFCRPTGPVGQLNAGWRWVSRGELADGASLERQDGRGAIPPKDVRVLAQRALEVVPASTPPSQLRLGLLSSHGGTNMQAIIDACASGRLGATVGVAISNNSGSMALQRARREGIPGYHLSGKTHPAAGALDDAILATLEEHGVDLVILAGYMKLLGPKTVAHFRGNTLNIHPALLPKFGGRGLYGLAVHRAVLAAGEKVTGVTIHLADERFDHGPIVAQTQVPVLEGDTADSLSRRVLKREHHFYVETLARIERGEIDLADC